MHVPMIMQIRKIWDSLRSSFWFVPAIMAAAAAALAFGSVALDETVAYDWLKTQTWAYTGGAEGASLVLSTIAGSMITITGVVFSMTLVALSLASSQLGPRLLRNFMRDRVNQTVLGTFVATFVYCLLVLRTIRRADESLFVPHLSVTFGVLFALVGLGVLIYFIHHVSVSIQADEVVARVGKELMGEIDRLFPEKLGEQPPPDAMPAKLPADFDQTACPVGASGDGYLQRIDNDALMALAEERDMVFRVARRPGDYVTQTQPLVRAWPGSRVDDELARKLNEAFTLGTQRTSAQDVRFPIQQLVEIAVRALSPGVNDPFTAVACVDSLGSALSRLARRAIPSAVRIDKAGRLRIVSDPLDFAVVVDTAFTQLRQHARSSAVVAVRLLETIIVIAARIDEQASRSALLRIAAQVNAGAQEALPDAGDRLQVERLFQAAQRSLDVPILTS